MSIVLSPTLLPAERDLVDHSSRIPLDDGGPVFAEPWQAQAFAMTLRLHQQGVFSWAEWAQALAGEIAKAGPAAPPSHYYRWWMAALEQLASAKSLVQPGELALRQQAWRDAAAVTPHGEPVVLGRNVMDKVRTEKR